MASLAFAVRGPLFRLLFMGKLSDVLLLRVRYSETDQMGTFYNARALEWFECGRSELMRRRLGMSYAESEAKGVFLPLVEAHLEFQGGARYDDLLSIASSAELCGRARLRFDVQITQHESGRPVVRGYTIHAFTGPGAKPIRPPEWFLEMLRRSDPTDATPERRIDKGAESPTIGFSTDQR
jgi:acyl-CoA thioester hydrolase